MNEACWGCSGARATKFLTVITEDSQTTVGLCGHCADRIVKNAKRRGIRIELEAKEPTTHVVGKGEDTDE